jgi:hypothetical protein
MGLIAGFIVNVKTRTAFMTAALTSQVSEFSLVVAVSAFRFKIFDEDTLEVMLLTSILSFFVSGLLIMFVDPIFELIRPCFRCYDLKDDWGEAKDNLTDHIVLLEYSEITHEAAMLYQQANETNVYLIDLDPAAHRRIDRLQNAALGTANPAAENNSAKSEDAAEAGGFQYDHEKNSDFKFQNVVSVWADQSDPAVWDRYNLNQAKIVICGMQCLPHVKKKLAARLKAAKVPCLVVTDSHSEAKELYEAGARYAIQTEYTAALSFKKLLSEEIHKSNEEMFVDVGKHDKNMFERLKEQYATLLALF